MKHGRKPTRQQRILLAKWHLDPQDWLIVKDLSDRLEVVHRHFDNVTRVIHKGDRYD